MELIDAGKVLFSPNLEAVSKEEILKMCPLVGESKSNDFVRMNNTIFHKKQKKMKFLLNELIGEIISEYFDLQTKKSIVVQNELDLGREELRFYLISKVFFEEGLNYLRYDDFVDVRNDEYENLNNLGRLTKFWDCNTGEEVLVDVNSLEILKSDLKKLIVRDFLPEQKDRNVCNFMFGYEGNRVKLMPVYDYEHSFDKYYYINILGLHLFLKRERDFIRHDAEFQNLFQKLMDFKFDFVINKLEAEHGIILNYDEKHLYESVILKQQKLVRKKRIIY